jgi:pyruvate formate lyase activating enzyme
MSLTLAQILADRRAEGAPEVTERLPGDSLRCLSCAHRCVIKPGRDGICRVRSNVDGKLMVPRGYVAGVQVDPIEKKPFFHVLPGNDALSFGMLGCDLHCAYCFPGDVRVATTEGTRRIGDLFDDAPAGPSAEERLPATPTFIIADDGSRRQVRRFFRHKFAGELVSIRTRFLPGFEATPDHPVLATAKPGELAPTFFAAGELCTGMYLALPRKHEFQEENEIDTASLLERHVGTVRRGKRTATATVEKILELSTAGVPSVRIGAELGLRADSVRHIRSLVRRRGGDASVLESFRDRLVMEEGRVRFGQERRPGIPARIEWSLGFAELLGLYCAEGCTVKSRTRPNSRSVVFAFGPGEDSLASRARHLLESAFGVEGHEFLRDTTRIVTSGKTSVSTVFHELCGSGAARKRIPAALFRVSKEVASAFLRGLVAGDGHRYPDGKVSLTTVSEDLAWDAALLLLRLGILPSIYIAERASKGTLLGREVNQQPRQYTLVWREVPTKRRLWHADEEYWYVPIRSVTRRPHDGWVYNLEAEGRHTYLANGFAVHNCQNWVTSQALRDPVAGTGPKDIEPEELTALALREHAPVVVSTYNEPLITSEWAKEVMTPAKAAGLLCGFVSNGNATEEVLDFIRPLVSLYKIDLKSFNDKHYRSLGAPLEHILEGIRLVHRKGFWLEIVSLLIPGFNDDEAELRDMARFLRSISPDIPWHVTGFHDDYKMNDQGDTPASTLIRAAEIGTEVGLHFVYAGNRPGRVGEWENTRCSSCARTLIRRQSFRVLECSVGHDGACPGCGTKLPGVWDHPLAQCRSKDAPALPRRVR